MRLDALEALIQNQTLLEFDTVAVFMVRLLPAHTSVFPARCH